MQHENDRPFGAPSAKLRILAIAGITAMAVATFMVNGKRDLIAADAPQGDTQSVQLRFVGGQEQTPLAGAELLITQGYGQLQKKFGPWTLDETGTVQVALAKGFYSLRLSSKKEWPYLTVEKAWAGRSRTIPPSLNLYVTESGVEKWLDGKRREEGFEPPKQPDGAPRITYTLLPACELVLRAVDIETGQGLPGVSFYTENAVGEDWAHVIWSENLRTPPPEETRSVEHAAHVTDGEGNFRRLIGANAGYAYGVALVPAGYELVEPLYEVEIEVTYGAKRAEQTFKFRKVR
jgi:hypothetical protein